jgi:hypothetical protein
MNTKAESLYRHEGKRDHEHIQRGTVNTKIVRTPRWMSYMREREREREKRDNEHKDSTNTWMDVVQERERTNT